ncbi:MAG: 8-oxo-dGTP diphosphatase [Acutalibacteraceae bacterium]
MEKTQTAELTVMCMVCDGTKILVQDRHAEDWPGVTFPGGHVEPGEAFTDAVRREVKEETGLDILRPTLCGVKDYIQEDGSRYIVMLFRADNFSGELRSSDEGRVFWIERDELTQYKLACDFIDMVHVMENPSLTEFFYERDGESWKKRII